MLVQPQKLVLGRVAPDELNRGYSKLNVAFTLSPGSYATLVVKRLFHREGAPAEEPKGAEIPWRSGAHTPYGPRPSRTEVPAARAQRATPPEGRATAGGVRPAPPQPPAKERPSPTAPPLGFRAQAFARKQARKAAREAAAPQLRKPSKA